jgi:hypothetical protein
MTDLVVQIRFSQQQEAWEPSYPGDPLVRPASYVFDIRFNERSLLEGWLNESTPGYRVNLSSMRHPTGIRTFSGQFNNVSLSQFPDGWNEGSVHFSNKAHAMLFKLAFA